MGYAGTMLDLVASSEDKKPPQSNADAWCHLESDSERKRLLKEQLTARCAEGLALALD